VIAADWRPTRRKLRQFSGALLVVAAVLALRRGADGWSIAAGVLALTGLLWPPAARPFYLALTVISLPIGWMVSHVLLRVIYYLVLTPVALVFRIFGRDPLALRRRDAASHWEPFKQGEDIESYFRQT
jgi:hypothetical protein